MRITLDDHVRSDHWRLPGMYPVKYTNVFPVLLISAMLVGGTLSGCSWKPGWIPGWNSGDTTDAVRYNTTDEAQQGDIATSRSTLVATDLVSAMIQIPELQPDKITLALHRPESNYGRVLAKELQRVGYDMRVARSPDEPHLLDYRITSANPSGADREYEFSLAVGQVKLKRRYTLEGSEIYPTSSLFVRGASHQNIKPDDSLFRRDLSPGTRKLQRKRIVVPTKQNMYETRESNFIDQLASYKDVTQSVIVFPNDSVVLGSLNRQLTRSMLQEFNPATDLISVIGCSHGNTALTDGNRKLANGRSLRVREELIRAGVNPELILDEGCWAPVYFDEMMPRRGVVLTLKRFQQNG